MDNSKQKIIYDLLIVGGGASGLSAAVSSNLLSKQKNKKLNIAIVESSDKIGKSILKTGNGRCNFSNTNITIENSSEYFNKKFVKKVFQTTEQVVDKYKIFKSLDNNNECMAALKMFEKLGLIWQTDKENRLYPYTNKATTVVDIFRYSLSKSAVKIIRNFRFENIIYRNNCFIVSSSNTKKLIAKKVIICCGKSLNNTILWKENFIKFQPILGPIETDNKYTKSLDGIRSQICCTLYEKNKKKIASEKGEILFRKYGVSGICIFNLSRFVKKNMNQILGIDFFPKISTSKILSILNKRFTEYSPNRKTISIEVLFAGILLPQISKVLGKKLGLDLNQIWQKDIESIVAEAKNFTLRAKKITNEKFCQGARGGIDVNSLNENLSYKLNNNLYFAGEAIDVDGPCGGYNLHWAWTSGILSGISAIE